VAGKVYHFGTKVSIFDTVNGVGHRWGGGVGVFSGVANNSNHPVD
jgi:hypothetical protein